MFLDILSKKCLEREESIKDSEERIKEINGFKDLRINHQLELEGAKMLLTVFIKDELRKVGIERSIAFITINPK